MSKELTVMVEGTRANGKGASTSQDMSPREFMSHIKQLVKSVAQSGIVHEVEDRKNPFNGIAIDEITIFRSEDWEPVGDDEDDESDDDGF